ncbi:hypothetical protein DFH11DRAFT_363379 [Phellopilus nigrolimitatus]|nr:hypothetical protein DFH11DRAFT_363379 [Phellopilus nigrolimitatus]
MISMRRFTSLGSDAETESVHSTDEAQATDDRAMARSAPPTTLPTSPQRDFLSYFHPTTIAEVERLKALDASASSSTGVAPKPPRGKIDFKTYAEVYGEISPQKQEETDRLFGKGYFTAFEEAPEPVLPRKKPQRLSSTPSLLSLSFSLSDLFRSSHGIRKSSGNPSEPMFTASGNHPYVASKGTFLGVRLRAKPQRLASSEPQDNEAPGRPRARTSRVSRSKPAKASSSLRSPSATHANRVRRTGAKAGPTKTSITGSKKRSSEDAPDLDKPAKKRKNNNGVAAPAQPSSTQAVAHSVPKPLTREQLMGIDWIRNSKGRLYKLDPPCDSTTFPSANVDKTDEAPRKALRRSPRNFSDVKDGKRKSRSRSKRDGRKH